MGTPCESDSMVLFCPQCVTNQPVTCEIGARVSERMISKTPGSTHGVVQDRLLRGPRREQTKAGMVGLLNDPFRHLSERRCMAHNLHSAVEFTVIR